MIRGSLHWKDPLLQIIHWGIIFFWVIASVCEMQIHPFIHGQGGISFFFSFRFGIFSHSSRWPLYVGHRQVTYTTYKFHDKGCLGKQQHPSLRRQIDTDAQWITLPSLDKSKTCAPTITVEGLSPSSKILDDLWGVTEIGTGSCITTPMATALSVTKVCLCAGLERKGEVDKWFFSYCISDDGEKMIHYVHWRPQPQQDSTLGIDAMRTKGSFFFLPSWASSSSSSWLRMEDGLGKFVKTL